MTTENSTTALIKVAPSNDADVMSFHNKALRLKEYADRRVIATVEDMKSATNDLSIIAKVKNGMEKKRKDYLSPFQDHVKETNEAYKSLIEPIESADKTTRSKILAYQAEQERIRQEQEEINRMRLEAAQKEAALHNGEITESVNLVEVMPEAPRRVSTDMGTVGQRENWKYEVLNFTLLPDEYKVADHTMLNDIAKKHHDQKQIPGVRFYNEPILAVRTR